MEKADLLTGYGMAPAHVTRLTVHCSAPAIDPTPQQRVHVYACTRVPRVVLSDGERPEMAQAGASGAVVCTDRHVTWKFKRITCRTVAADLALEVEILGIPRARPHRFRVRHRDSGVALTSSSTTTREVVKLPSTRFPSGEGHRSLERRRTSMRRRDCLRSHLRTGGVPAHRPTSLLKGQSKNCQRTPAFGSSRLMT
eukprot:3935824-Rhodomonas_salina.1